SNRAGRPRAASRRGSTSCELASYEKRASSCDSAAVSKAVTTQGLLLCNLGTPDAPTPSAVRRYLREFLSDPRVLDIHPIARWALLNLIILPTRPRKSAAAYQQIWGRDGDGPGSPLLRHSLDLTAAV